MNVGHKIKALRESKNISKEQMCDHLHISLNTYKKIEYGEKSPTLVDLKIIAGVFNVDPTLFLKDDKTSNINNGDYTLGFKNVERNEKDLIINFTKSIEKLSESILTMANAIDKK